MSFYVLDGNLWEGVHYNVVDGTLYVHVGFGVLIRVSIRVNTSDLGAFYEFKIVARKDDFTLEVGAVDEALHTVRACSMPLLSALNESICSGWPGARPLPSHMILHESAMTHP